MPMTNVNNEHEQLISILNQLMDQREMLIRENEYLKAKLNESVLIETINEMKKERHILFKLLANVTTKFNNDEQLRNIKQNLKENNTESLPPSSYSTLNGKFATSNNLSVKQNTTMPRYNRSLTIGHVHRLKTNTEQQPPIVYRLENTRDNVTNNPNILSSVNQWRNAQTNKKVQIPKTPEFHQCTRKLKHSPNSAFQHYRSQSLQDLT